MILANPQNHCPGPAALGPRPDAEGAAPETGLHRSPDLKLRRDEYRIFSLNAPDNRKSGFFQGFFAVFPGIPTPFKM